MKTSLKRRVKQLLLTNAAMRRVHALYSLYGFWNHLERIGWFQSRRAKMPVDGSGKVLPWFTYPCIAFLGDRIRRDLRVFEYGSGNSTLWWSQRVDAIVTCEHDRGWFDHLQSRLPENVHYMHVDLEYGGNYCSAISSIPHPFDVVVIDGRDRVNCAKKCVEALGKRGVIIWDNSDRSQYADGYRFLRERGFRRLDFWGIGPINKSHWCTSVFYRTDNCLDV